MRYVLIFVLSTLLCGCASSPPVVPQIAGDSPFVTASQEPYDPHMLWGKWKLYFPAERDRVDVVPQRIGRFHLNATKFLEVNCADCLKITGIHNNGDSTINLDVQIKHPFPGLPQYTGFDVKGIIMFEGSLEFPHGWHPPVYFPPNDYMAVVSWRELGDAELLNADGYAFRWSPQWVEDSDLPIFKYFPGKYSSGTPTANINGYMNYYTLEDRHIFEVDGIVTRTYHIYLPPGPVVAGYAIEACWAPPSITPVTDPVTDFPSSANQTEPYLFKYILNNGQPITEEPCCYGTFIGDCSRLKVECARWDGIIPAPDMDSNTFIYWYFPDGDKVGNGDLWLCDPIIEDTYWDIDGCITCEEDVDGTYRYLARVSKNISGGPHPHIDLVYSMLDFTIDLQ